MHLKKIIATFLVFTLLLSCYGCSKPSGQRASIESKGRYMEDKISLPLPDDATQQALIGMNATANGMEYFTMSSSGTEGSYHTFYYRHTIADDGSISTTPEKWLEDCAPQSGNQLSLVRAADGTLYFTFGDYDENSKAQNHIFVSRDDGQTCFELKGNGIGVCSMILALAPLDDGRIAVQDMDGSVLLLDAEGNLADELGAGAYNGGIAAYGNKVAVLAPSGKAVRVYDLTSGESVDWDIDIPEDSASKMEFSDDGTLYLACPSGLYSHTPDGTIWEIFVDGDTTNLGIPSFYISYLAVIRGEKDVIYVADYEDGLYRYAYDPEAAQIASMELDVFSLVENDMVRHAMVAFNRQRSDVKVKYTVASDLAGGGTNADYIKALNTGLLAGDGPDVIILDGLPLDSYIEKGVLADIGEVVSSADAMLPNIRQAYEENGVLYAIPLGIRLPVAITKGDVNAFASLSALADTAEATTGADVLSSIAYSYETLSTMLLENYGDALYSGDDVKAFLQGAKRISDSIGSTEALGEGLDLSFQISEDELHEMLLADQFFPQIYAYVLGKAQSTIFDIGGLDDSACMAGTSVAEQYGGSLCGIGGRFMAVGLAGVNKASGELETAKDFLRMLLSLEIQGTQSYRSRCFPVNQEALAASFANANLNISVGYHVDDEHEVYGEWPSAPMRAQIMRMIEQADTPMTDNAELKGMLLPAIVSYLDGSRTLDEAAEVVTSVLSTYLSE